MSYKSPIASTSNFGIVKIGSGISVSQGTISASTGLLNYGFFTGNRTQTNPRASEVNIITYDDTGPSNGISISGGNALRVDNEGIYTKLFTLLISKTSLGSSTISIWLRLDGVDVPESRQDLILDTTAPSTFTSGNFTLKIPAGSTIQMCWSSADTSFVLAALPTATTPIRPTGAAVKVTLTKIN